MKWSAPRVATITASLVAVMFILVMGVVVTTTEPADPHAAGKAVGRAVLPLAAVAWVIGYAVQSSRVRDKK